VAQLPYLVGKQAVERITDVINGGEVEEFQFVDTMVLTQEVLEAGEHPLLQYVR